MEATSFNATVAHAASALPMLSADGVNTATIIRNLQAAPQDVTQAVAKAARKAAVISPDGKHVISAWQSDLYDLLFSQADSLNTLETTQQAKLQAFLKSHYGKTAPTFKQFQADRAALKTLAAFKGLVDDQWLRKPYNLAVKALYGTLPVAMTAAAIAKREQRATQPKVVKAPVGAPKGETAPRNSSVSEQVEQMVAKFGVFETMKAITAILKADAKTHTDAVALEAIAAHYKAA